MQKNKGQCSIPAGGVSAAILVWALMAISSCSTTDTSLGSFDCAGMTYITTNTTLSAGVYNVGCNITVSNNAVLTISPGTTLQFAQDAALTIRPGAAINAAGTPGQPIIFTGTQSVPGYWRGIIIESRSLNNVFSYCTLSSGGDAVGNPFGADVTLQNATASFSHCTITGSSGAGIYFSASSPDSTFFNSFTGNQVSQNGQYPIITYTYAASTIGAGNTFTGNTYNYIGILSSEVRVPVSLSSQSVPYLFLQTGADAGVTFDQALTIAPGTSILMDSGISLLASATGSISATGTSTLPITFAGRQSYAGYWGSVIIHSSSTLNNFEYCNFSYGGGTPAHPILAGESSKGFLSTYMPSPAARSIVATGCTFSYSASSGIYVAAADGSPLPTFNANIGSVNTFTGCNPDIQY